MSNTTKITANTPETLMAKEAPASQLVYWLTILGGIAVVVFGVTRAVKFFLPN